MHADLNGHMRVGILHFMAFPECAGGEGPIAETLPVIANDPFFDLVEITQIKDPAVRQAVRARIDEAQIEAVFGAQPILLGGGLDLNHFDAAERARALDAMKQAVDQAVELGCTALAVLSGKVTPDRDAALERLVDSLEQLCAYAAPHGLRILLETFDQVNYGKNCLIGPTADAVHVSQAVRATHPDFGLILDLSHLPLLNEPSLGALEAAGGHLAHVHIGNCAMDDPSHPAYGDNHPRFGMPGTRNGAAELAEFLRALQTLGYIGPESRGAVSFEVKPQPGESSEAVIAGSKRTLLDAWRRL